MLSIKDEKVINYQKKIINEGIKELALLDVWHLRNPSGLIATHISTAHASWSRLVSARATNWVSDIEVLPRTLSDHSPVRLELHVPPTFTRQFTWRFRSEALLDPLYTHTV